jgi:hypothetical protein
MGVYEELFEFVHKRIPEIVDVLDVGIAVILHLDRDDAVIAHPRLFLSLSALDDPHHATFYENSRESRLIHEDEHVRGGAAPALVEGIKLKS